MKMDFPGGSMKTFRTIVSFTVPYLAVLVLAVLVLAGCVSLVDMHPGDLTMRVDPALEANAVVYDVVSPKSPWFERRLNVSFGRYRVEGAGGWTTTGSSTEDEMPLLLRLLGADSDSRIRSFRSSHAYRFRVGEEAAWDADCALMAEERETTEEDGEQVITTVETLWATYTCRYTRGAEDPWTLTVRQQGPSGREITMAGHGALYRAHDTGGTIAYTDGRDERQFPCGAGYTWTEDERPLAAISVGERAPRVWLARGNPEAVNDALSMASAGLLVFRWKMASKIKEEPVTTVTNPEPLIKIKK